MMATQPSVVVHVDSALVQSLHLLGMQVQRSKAAPSPPASTGTVLAELEEAEAENDDPLRFDEVDMLDVLVVLDVTVELPGAVLVPTGVLLVAMLVDGLTLPCIARLEDAEVDPALEVPDGVALVWPPFDSPATPLFGESPESAAHARTTVTATTAAPDQTTEERRDTFFQA